MCDSHLKILRDLYLPPFEDFAATKNGKSFIQIMKTIYYAKHNENLHSLVLEHCVSAKVSEYADKLRVMFENQHSIEDFDAMIRLHHDLFEQRLHELFSTFYIVKKSALRDNMSDSK